MANEASDGPFKQYVEQSFSHDVSFSQTVCKTKPYQLWCLVPRPSLNSATLNAGLKKCNALGDATLEGTPTDSSSESAGFRFPVTPAAVGSVQDCAQFHCSLSGCTNSLNTAKLLILWHRYYLKKT